MKLSSNEGLLSAANTTAPIANSGNNQSNPRCSAFEKVNSDLNRADIFVRRPKRI